MKVAVNIKVRNPEWFWSQKEIKKSNKEGEMSYEEWKMINEGKIAKYTDLVDFEFLFDVEKHLDNRFNTYDLKFSCEENGTQIEKTYKLNDVTTIDFIGAEKQSTIVVSNSLINQFLSAVKKGQRFYWYFYLKGGIPYTKIGENIWIDEMETSNLMALCKNISFDQNIEIKLRKQGWVF